MPVLYMQPTSFHIIARTTRTRDRPTASTPGTVRRSREAADAPVDGFAARSFAFASSFQADPGKHLPRDALEVDAKIPLLELGHGVGMGDASSAQGELTHQLTSEVTRDAKLPGSVHASHARVGFIQSAVREARGLVRAPGATRESPPFVLAQPRKAIGVACEDALRDVQQLGGSSSGGEARRSVVALGGRLQFELRT